MQSTNIITLTTDFGLTDPFVGQMKGMLLSRNPEVRIIDLCHGIPAHDILTGAMTIHTSYDYFPSGSFHLVVVDPGVGSQRKILVVAADNHIFIAPDNGLLTLILQECANPVIHRVDNPSLLPSKISGTFHGRDIMAPVAAALAGGMPLDQVGPTENISSCVHIELPEPIISKAGIEGRVTNVDHFGNIRANITSGDLSKSLFQIVCFNGIRIKKHQINCISNTYSDVPPGSLVALFDSSGYLEISVNQGDAARKTGCRIGDPVYVLMESDNIA